MLQYSNFVDTYRLKHSLKKNVTSLDMAISFLNCQTQKQQLHSCEDTVKKSLTLLLKWQITIYENINVSWDENNGFIFLFHTILHKKISGINIAYKDKDRS